MCSGIMATLSTTAHRVDFGFNIVSSISQTKWVLNTHGGQVCKLNVYIQNHTDYLNCNIDGIWDVASLITCLKTAALILFLATGLGGK